MDKQAYGGDAYVAFIHSLPCVGCHTPAQIECSHLKTRNTGGTWWQIVPKCLKCHRAWHNTGRYTWAKQHGYTYDGLLDHALQLARTFRERYPADYRAMVEDGAGTPFVEEPQRGGWEEWEGSGSLPHG